VGGCLVVLELKGVLALVVVALIATSCAEDAGDTTAAGSASGSECAEIQELIDATAAMLPSERETFLLKKAIEDGDNVSLYTELNVRDVDEIIDIFEETYNVDVDLFRAGSEDVRLRVLEEAAAGFRGFDLIEIEALDMTIIDQKGILAPASSPYREGIIEAGLFDNFTADRVTYLVPVWNTRIFSAAEAPQSFEDFADPRFSGQLALEDSDVYWFAVMVQHFVEEGMTEEEAVDLFKTIAANSSITSGHTATLELLIAGQFGITPNGYSHRVEEFKIENAPIEWLPVKVPVVAEITAVAVACSAKNAAGGMLLEDFFLNPDTTQAYFVSVNRTPANAAQQAEAFGPGGADIVPLRGDVSAIVEDFQKWDDLWDEVVRSG